MNPDLADLVDRFGVVHLMRTSDRGLELLRLDLHRPLVACAGVGIELLEIPFSLHPGEPASRHLIRREKADLRARFNSHICDGHSTGHFEAGYRLSSELESLIGRTGGAYPSDEMEDDILAIHSHGERTLHQDPDRLRNPEPSLSEAHGHRCICRPNPCCKGPQSPSRAGMGIGSYHHRPRSDKLLCHNLMGDAQTDVRNLASRLFSKLPEEGMIVAARILWGMFTQIFRPVSSPMQLLLPHSQSISLLYEKLILR